MTHITNKLAERDFHIYAEKTQNNNHIKSTLLYVIYLNCV